MQNYLLRPCLDQGHARVYLARSFTKFAILVADTESLNEKRPCISSLETDSASLLHDRAWPRTKWAQMKTAGGDATIRSGLDYPVPKRLRHQPEKRRQDSASFTSVTESLIELPDHEAGAADVCISAGLLETLDLSP